MLLKLKYQPHAESSPVQVGQELTLVGEDEVVVDLVGDDGEAVSVGDLEDGGEVLGSEDGPARVRRVVHHDRHSVLVNLRTGRTFEVLQSNCSLSLSPSNMKKTAPCQSHGMSGSNDNCTGRARNYYM